MDFIRNLWSSSSSHSSLGEAQGKLNHVENGNFDPSFASNIEGAGRVSLKELAHRVEHYNQYVVPVIEEHTLHSKEGLYYFQEGETFPSQEAAIAHLKKGFSEGDLVVLVKGERRSIIEVGASKDQALKESFLTQEPFLIALREKLETILHLADTDYFLENKSSGKLEYVAKDPETEMLRRFESVEEHDALSDLYWDKQTQTDTVLILEIDQKEGMWVLKDRTLGEEIAFASKEELDIYIEQKFLTPKEGEKPAADVLELCYLQGAADSDNASVEKKEWIRTQTQERFTSSDQLYQTLSGSKKKNKQGICEWGLRYLDRNEVLVLATKPEGIVHYKNIFERDKDLHGKGISKKGAAFLLIWAASTGIQAYKAYENQKAFVEDLKNQEAKKIEQDKLQREAFERLQKQPTHRDRTFNAQGRNLKPGEKPGKTAIVFDLFGEADFKSGRGEAIANNMDKLNQEFSNTYYKNMDPSLHKHVTQEVRDGRVFRFVDTEKVMRDVNQVLADLKATGHDVEVVLFNGHGNIHHVVGMPYAGNGNYKEMVQYISPQAAIIMGGCQTGAPIEPIQLPPGAQCVTNCGPSLNVVQGVAAEIADLAPDVAVYGNTHFSVADGWQVKHDDSGKLEVKSFGFAPGERSMRMDKMTYDMTAKAVAKEYLSPSAAQLDSLAAPEPIAADPVTATATAPAASSGDAPLYYSDLNLASAASAPQSNDASVPLAHAKEEEEKPLAATPVAADLAAQMQKPDENPLPLAPPAPTNASIASVAPSNLNGEGEGRQSDSSLLAQIKREEVKTADREPVHLKPVQLEPVQASKPIADKATADLEDNFNRDLPLPSPLTRNPSLRAAQSALGEGEESPPSASDAAPISQSNPPQKKGWRFRFMRFFKRIITFFKFKRGEKTAQEKEGLASSLKNRVSTAIPKKKGKF